MKLKFKADLRKSCIVIDAPENTFMYSFLDNGIRINKNDILTTVEEASDTELRHVSYFIEELIEQDTQDKIKFDVIYKDWQNIWLPEGTTFYFYNDIKATQRFEKREEKRIQKEAAEDVN